MVCVTSAVVRMRNGSAHVMQMLLRAVLTYMDKVVGQGQIYQSVFPYPPPPHFFPLSLTIKLKLA